MASNDSGAGPQKWKHGAAKAIDKPAVAHEWHAEEDSEPGKKRWRRRLIARSVVLATIVCGIGYLIWLIHIYRPIRVVLAGAGYETNLAVEHNAWGWGSLTRLKERLQGSSVTSPWWHSGEMKIDDPVRLGVKADWEELAAKLKRFNGETLVLVLALHGGVDEKGPYLFLDDVGYSGQDDLVRMEEVLDLMKDLSAKNKVLILEPAQIGAQWSRGMVSNDFVRELRGLEERITQIKGLVVLCASGVDQRSWPSEHTGLTVFSDFLVQGLRGAADDTRVGGDGNGRVDAWELASYVQKKVPIWVNAAHNSAVQTPLVLPAADGRKRAEGIELALVRDDADFPSPPRSSLSPATLGTIRKAWAEADELAGRVPSPAVYSPHLWRRYRDTLLRYEALLLADSDKDQVEAVRTSMDDLRKRLRSNGKARWQSAHNTLTMPAALGLAPIPSESDLSKPFEDLWKNYPQKRIDLQKWMEQYLPDPAQQDPKLAGLAFNKVIENPDPKNLANALLAEIRRRPGLKPAEFHFLDMYLHLYDDKQLPDSPDQPKPELLQLALRVRRQAEEVAVAASRADEKEAPFHPYSEQVFPWIQKQVEEADQERRLGEDLLFASSPYRDGARSHLDHAQETYKRAKEIATDVRKALELRDRVMADLPYYAQWLARVPETSLLDRVEQLGQKTRELAQLLDQRSPDTRGLRTLCSEIEAKLRDLKSEQAAKTEDCLNAERVQTNWDKIQALLSLPVTKPSDRMRLLNHLDQVALKLGGKASETASETVSQEETPKAEDGRAEERARELALRQEHMALAVLWEIPAQPRPANVGQKVGSYLQALPANIEKLTSQALTEDLKDAARHLREADQLARFLDGGGAQALKPGLDPCAENRNVNLHNLLVWQARRTFKDHWWSKSQKAVLPYYNLACKAYLEDAKALAAPEDRELEPSKKEIRLSQVRALRAQLDNAKELVLKNSTEPLDVTSDPVASVRFRLEASEELLPAFPVLWRSIDSPILSLERARVDERFPKADFGDKKPATAADESFEVKDKGLDEEERNPPPAPRIEPAKVALNALYRGRIISQPTTIRVHHGVNITRLRYPEPPDASLAIWSDEKTLQRLALSQGALDIVVDYSGSMGGDKIRQALAALKEALQGLPEGVTLGVWVFGQEGNFLSPEATVQPVWRPRPWHPEQLDGLMEILQKLRPRSLTPLVRAMAQAAEADLDKFTGSPKILLVLTDGADNRFVKGADAKDNPANPSVGDPKFNPSSKGDPGEIPRFLRTRFENSDITINMVLFDPPPNEGTIAHQQFKVIEKLPQRGKLYDASDVDELRRNLKLSLLQQVRCQLIRGNKAVEPKEGVEIMALLRNENPAWFPGSLVAGWYTGNIRNLHPQPIQLADGDFLYAVLKNGRLQRRMAGDRAPAERQQKSSSGDWLLGVMQNQLRPDGSLQMLVTLEKRSGAEAVLKQVKPKFTWFELKPQGVQQPVSVRWENLARYPAYAAGLDVPEWPDAADRRPAMPELHAWWTKEEPTPHARISLLDIKGIRPDSTRVLKLGPDKVTIEKVEFVDQFVQEPGKTSKLPCLVIRIRYPQGRPVLARLEVQGPELRGQQDRFYHEANSCTGIFWPLQASQADKLILELISLEKFKTDPGTETCTLKLPEPNPRDDRNHYIQPAQARSR